MNTSRTLFLLFFLVTSTAFAQTDVRVGYADVDYILSRMPEIRAVESELKVTEDQLAKQIAEKTQEIQNKYSDYIAKEQEMLPAIKASAQRELQILQQSLEQFKLDAQTAYEKKHLELMEPVYQKVGDAISAVAKENNYAFILNAMVAGQDIVLYGQKNNDVSDLVLQKLGVASTASSENPE